MRNINNQKPMERFTIILMMIPLMLVLFITNLDQTIVAASMTTIGKELHGLSSVQWMATAYLLTSAVTTLLFGKLGDMYGRKHIFQISLVIFLIGSILCGAAQNIVTIIVCRALQGIGGGGLNSLSQAIVGDIVPPSKRSKYLAYSGIMAVFALVVGPFLGGLFSDTISWRWIFYINIPIGVLAFFMIAFQLRLPKPMQNGNADFAGGILAAMTSTVILLFLTLGGNQYAWQSAPIIGLGVASILGLILYILIERKAIEPITPLHLFQSGMFDSVSIQFLFSNMVLFVGMMFVPMYLQSIFRLSAFQSGLMMIPQLLGLVATVGVSGLLIARTGKYKVYLIAGGILTGVGTLFLGFTSQNASLLFIVLAMIVFGAGEGLLGLVCLLTGQNAVEYRFLGVATGALNFFKYLGGSFGTAIFGALLNAGLAKAKSLPAQVAAYQRIFFLCTIFMSVTTILGILIKEKPLSNEIQEKAGAPHY